MATEQVKIPRFPIPSHEALNERAERMRPLVEAKLGQPTVRQFVSTLYRSWNNVELQISMDPADTPLHVAVSFRTFETAGRSRQLDFIKFGDFSTIYPLYDGITPPVGTVSAPGMAACHTDGPWVYAGYNTGIGSRDTLNPGARYALGKWFAVVQRALENLPSPSDTTPR